MEIILYLIFSLLFHMKITASVDPSIDDLHARITSLDEKLDTVLSLVKNIDKIYACKSPRVDNSVHYNDDKVYLFGDEVSVSCFREHTRVGDRKLQCLGRDVWSGNTKCQQSECQRPKLKNGYLIGNSTYIRDVLHAYCDEGFIRQGNSKVKCMPRLYWTKLPVCIPTCQTPRVPNSNFEDKIDVFRNGSYIDIRCNYGYILEGSSRLLCTGLNKWSDTAECKLNDCGDLPAFEFGSYESNYTTTFKSNVSVSCNQGYRNIGSHFVFCGEHVWLGHPMCKERICVDVTLNNGTKTAVCFLKHVDLDMRYMQNNDVQRINNQTACLTHCLSNHDNISFVKMHDDLCTCSMSRYVYKTTRENSYVYQVEAVDTPMFF